MSSADGQARNDRLHLLRGSSVDAALNPAGPGDSFMLVLVLKS